MWRNRSFREIRRIYLFSSRVICRRARGCGGARFGKIHLTDTRRLLWSPGAPLSAAGTGRQLRARAKDEPGDICFPFVDKHIAFGVSEWRCVSRRRERKRERTEREKKIYFQALAPGPLIRIDVRQVDVQVRSGFDGSVDAVAIKILASKGGISLYTAAALDLRRILCKL